MHKAINRVRDINMCYLSNLVIYKTMDHKKDISTAATSDRLRYFSTQKAPTERRKHGGSSENI